MIQETLPPDPILAFCRRVRHNFSTNKAYVISAQNTQPFFSQNLFSQRTIAPPGEPRILQCIMHKYVLSGILYRILNSGCRLCWCRRTRCGLRRERMTVIRKVLTTQYIIRSMHSGTTTLPRTSYFQPLFLQNLIACSGVLKASCMFDIGSAVLVHPISGFDQRSCDG